MSDISTIYNLLNQAVEIQHLGKMNGVVIDILRLDTIDPFISGNKLFKLYAYLNEALTTDCSTILTFGGAHSNHLIATAKACRLLGLTSIGIVRGEANEVNSFIINKCIDLGMKIHYSGRKEYRSISEHPNKIELCDRFGRAIIVPMGGYSREGVAGASLIFNYIPENTYTHITTPVGTGTTLAGLLKKERSEEIVAYPAIKGMTDLNKRMYELGIMETSKMHIVPSFHFGGFAKKDDRLIHFINNFYKKYGVPLDFVYTGKMMFGIMEQIQNNYFPKGSHILAIHTGGLQGNRSLPINTLIF